MALTITLDRKSPARINKGTRLSILTGTIAFDSSYPTGGEDFTGVSKYFRTLQSVILDNTSGYVFAYDETNKKVKVFLSSGTPAITVANESTHTHAITLDGGVTAGEAAHTHAAGAITVTGGALNLASPAFSGTGLTAAGQVMTTTDNQTMTLNECAGMWLLPATATTAPMLIVSNTAVTGAQAVLTVIGTAATDAGAYKIVKILTSATGAATGAGSSHTHGPGTLADAASAAGSAHNHTATATGEAADEVANTTNLAALTSVSFVAIGIV